MRDSLGPPFAVHDGGCCGLFGTLARGRPVLVLVTQRFWQCDITVYDAETGVPIGASDVGKWHAQGGLINSHVYRDPADPDRAVLVTALDGELVRQWLLPHPAPAHPDLRLARPGDVAAPRVQAVTSFVDDGRTILVLGDAAGAVRRFDAVSGVEVAPPLVHQDGIQCLAVYTVDGRPHLACGDQTGRLWRRDAVTGEQAGPPVHAHQDMCGIIVPLQSGGRTVLAMAAVDQSVQRVDAVGGELVGDLLAYEDGVAGMCPTPGPVLTMAAGGLLLRLDPATFEPVAAPLDWGGEFLNALCTVDVRGRTALFVTDELTIRRFDAATGDPWPL